MFQLLCLIALPLVSSTTDDLPQSFYDLSANLLDGTHQDFAEFKDSIVVITNIASECVGSKPCLGKGFTKRGYEALVTMHNDLSAEGLNVLAFPCNQFGEQEPGSPEEIAEFAKSKGAEFRLFEKIHVNGPETHDVYRWLKERSPGDVKWNFASTWVIDQDENVERFDVTSSWDSIIEKVTEKVTILKMANLKDIIIDTVTKKASKFGLNVVKDDL